MSSTDDIAAQLAAASAQQAVAVAQAAQLAQSQSATLPQYSLPVPVPTGTKYQQLLQIIDELGKDIKPTYTGNKICQERLKRSIIHARILVRECLLEAEKDRNAQAQSTLNAPPEKEKSATPSKQ